MIAGPDVKKRNIPAFNVSRSSFLLFGDLLFFPSFGHVQMNKLLI
jgi:hypothetical protein